MNPKPNLQPLSSPAQPAISIETGYDNSNPSSVELMTPWENGSSTAAIRWPWSERKLITVDESGLFTIRQELEPNARIDYSFQFNVALRNSGDQPEVVRLKIIWAGGTFDQWRNYLYLGYDSGAEWRILPVHTQNTTTDLELVVPPGRHLLCYTPKFDLEDCRAVLEKCAENPFFEIVDVAVTPRGNPVQCLRFGKGESNILITTRAHPYETVGAYCISGWLEAIREDPSQYEKLLDGKTVHVFPILNVDGAAEGNCMLSPEGVDYFFQRKVDFEEDETARTLAQFIRGLRPAFFLDIHNYMRPPLLDSFRASDEHLLNAFRKMAPDFSRMQKKWEFVKLDFPARVFMERCRLEFGTSYVVTEFPWYSRTPEEMRTFGARFLDIMLELMP